MFEGLISIDTRVHVRIYIGIVTQGMRKITYPSLPCYVRGSFYIINFAKQSLASGFCYVDTRAL